MIDDLIEKIKRITSEYTSSEKGKRLGQQIVDIIKKRTRTGKAVGKMNGPTGKFVKIKEKTVDYRKKYEKNLSEFTTPGRTNITATGQMLDSLRSESKTDSIVIYFEDKRTTELDGRPSKITNSKLAKYTQEGSNNRPARPFLNLSRTEMDEIAKTIKRDILEMIRRK